MDGETLKAIEALRQEIAKERDASREWALEISQRYDELVKRFGDIGALKQSIEDNNRNHLEIWHRIYGNEREGIFERLAGVEYSLETLSDEVSKIQKQRRALWLAYGPVVLAALLAWVAVWVGWV